MMRHLSSCFNHFAFIKVLLVTYLFTIGVLSAQTLPTGFTNVEVARDMPNPTALTFAPDGNSEYVSPDVGGFTLTTFPGNELNGSFGILLFYKTVRRY